MTESPGEKNLPVKQSAQQSLFGGSWFRQAQLATDNNLDFIL
jgi:hypothetical protein